MSSMACRTAPSLDTTIVVTNGKIARVEKTGGNLPDTATKFDLRGKWLMPGYVDAHVHFAEYRESSHSAPVGCHHRQNDALRTLSSMFGSETHTGKEAIQTCPMSSRLVTRYGPTWLRPFSRTFRSWPLFGRG